MTTITEDYVSYEVAKLLKEKGFDEQCRDFYRQENGNWLHRTTYEYNYFNLQMPRWEDCYSCPTHQTAMKWLREVHNKHCDIGYDIDLEWFFQIIDLKETVEYDYPETKYYHTENESGFNSYEDAVEAAIKYCLENLI